MGQVVREHGNKGFCNTVKTRLATSHLVRWVGKWDCQDFRPTGGHMLFDRLLNHNGFRLTAGERERL